MRLIDFENCGRGELKGISKAVYVIKNNGAEAFRNQFSLGAVGLRSAKSNLAARMRSHERDWTQYQPGPGQLHRHAASPWKRFWAVDLAGWSAKATELAEQVLYVNVAKRFRFIDHSCFACTDGEQLSAMLQEVWRNLELISQMNSTWEAPSYWQLKMAAPL
jgi:hypothetical protein